MHPPPPFQLPPPAAGPGGPARCAAFLARELARHGVTGIYTAAAEKFAVISITAGLTAWTNGQLLWCTYDGQRHAWPAGDTGSAAAFLAALARPAGAH